MVTELEGRLVAAFFNALEIDGRATANSEQTIKAFEGNPEHSADYFIYMAHNFGFEDIYLIKQNGEVLFSLLDPPNLLDNFDSDIHHEAELANVFQRSMTLLEPTFSAFTYSEAANELTVFMSIPVLEQKQGLIGAFIAKISTDKLYALFNDYIGLKTTGRILIGEKYKNGVLIVNKAQHSSDSNSKLLVKFGEKRALAMQLAVEGKQGHGMSTDYQGRKVLAAWNYLPRLNLGLVVEVDLDEVLVPLNKLYRLLGLFIIVIFIIVVLVVLFLTKSLYGPIKKLQDGMILIGEGNLDYKVGTQRNDEMGYLSRAVDQMVRRLKICMTKINLLNYEIKIEKEIIEERANFFAIVSHELRGPIAPIHEGVKILLEGSAGECTLEQQNILKMIYKAAKRLQIIIKDILDFRQLETGRMEYVKEECDLNELIKESAEMAHLIAQEKGLQLELRLAKHLPYVKCDKNRILEVIMNLIDNAIKFTTFGQVTIISSQVDQVIKIEVNDTSYGIAPEDISKLFISFSQVGTKLFGGTGLGLAICKMIISDHGGKIWVESELGKGSSFIFTLPLH